MNVYSDEAALLARVGTIAGKTFGELAEQCAAVIPQNPLHAKGWVGELLEHILGATAGNRSAPDFESLGIELKTLPLNAHHKPKESTFVCTVPLKGTAGAVWRESSVWRKLACVLWVPFEADPTINFSLRRVGTAFLWRPNDREATMLRSDWEEHMEMIALGKIHEIDARRGAFLQIRPKAYSSYDRTATFDDDGSLLMTNPRGFYLRSTFTESILKRHQSTRAYA